MVEPQDRSQRIAIIGGGRVGRTLGRVFRAAGNEIVLVVGRRKESAEESVRFIGGGRSGTREEIADSGAKIVLICVPDDAISDVARGLSVPAGASVVHVSGLHSSDVLAHPGYVGSLHPLRSFADPERAAADFEGTYCAIEGDARTTGRLEMLVVGAGGIPLTVDSEGKALYHAGAVFASNYVVAVFEAAVRLWEKAGLMRGEAVAALSGLAAGTVSNLSSVGLPGALTGPIERGDLDTVRRHEEEIRSRIPDLLPLYRELGRLTCEVAEAKGTADRGKIGEIRTLLEGE